MLVVTAVLIAGGNSYAKIPEPDNIYYGTAKIGGVPVKASNSEVVVSVKLTAAPAESDPVASYKMGSDPEAGDYYVLNVPIDARNPQLPNTARPGAEALIYIGEDEVATITIGERGNVQAMDINSSNPTDSDNDGLADIFEDINHDGNYDNDNTDGDAYPDYLDNDDDNDGVPTKNEDINLNGDYSDDDCDNDTVPNYLDEDQCAMPDSDNDGTPDYIDAFPNNPDEWADTDNDGTGDNADTDDDNDTMPDAWEIANNLDPLMANDSSYDPDGDNYTNLNEYLGGSDPQNEYSIPSIEDFESGKVDEFIWALEGNQKWHVVAETGSRINPDTSSSYLVTTPVLGTSQTASLTRTIYCETGMISFGYSLSTALNHDFFNFYIDNVLQDSWSGTLAYSRSDEYDVSQGKHTFSWRFSRDNSGNAGSAAWIDDIHFPESLDTDNDIMPDRWELQSGLNRNADDAAADHDSDGFYNLVEFLEGTSPSGSGDIPTVSSVSETFESGGSVPWLMYGDGLWAISDNNPYAGSYVAQSPVLGHNESASAEVFMFCDKGVVNFRYMVSSELNKDFLHFYIDDELKDSWSGEVGYTQSSSYEVAAGVHTFKWVYSKDASGTSGNDVARVDNINFAGSLDNDGDAIPDTWEIDNNMNPMINDSGADADDNGITNIDEFQAAIKPPDRTPPGPAGFAVNPAATGAGVITMTALTASDPEVNGVQYYFEETSGNAGANDSGWQDSLDYADAGLEASTIYTYRVRVRDKSSNLNESAWSNTRSAMTSAPEDLNPPSPNPAGFSSVPSANGSQDSITMTAVTAVDAEGSGVEYRFERNGAASAWQSSPSYTFSGLNEDTNYTFRVQARDTSANLNETGWSGEYQAKTAAKSGCGAAPMYNNGDFSGSSGLNGAGYALLPLIPAFLAFAVWAAIRRRKQNLL